MDQPEVAVYVEAPAFEAWIGHSLKERFQDVLREPLPREFIDLLPNVPGRR